MYGSFGNFSRSRHAQPSTYGEPQGYGAAPIFVAIGSLLVQAVSAAAKAIKNMPPEKRQAALNELKTIAQKGDEPFWKRRKAARIRNTVLAEEAQTQSPAVVAVPSAGYVKPIGTSIDAGLARHQTITRQPGAASGSWAPWLLAAAGAAFFLL